MRLAYLLLLLLFHSLFHYFILSMELWPFQAFLELCCICCSIPYFYFILAFFAGNPLSRSVRVKIKFRSFFPREPLREKILNSLLLVFVITEYQFLLFGWI